MTQRAPIIHAARPLRRIFWGALLVLLDVTFSATVNEVGFRLDLLDDTVGMVLITAAVATLRGMSMNPSYAARMGFVRWVSILALIESILDHFIFPQPALLALFVQTLGFAKILAVLLFCACMRDLCREAMMPEAGRKWSTTLVLFFLLYGIPIGLLTIAAMSPAGSFPIDLGPGLGPWILPAGLLFLVPLISFFGATSTMASEAEVARMPRAATSWPYVAAPPAD